MTPTDLDERPLRAVARDRIRERIVSGRLVPGDRLVERNLATELGVSRVPVREALRDLVAEGYAIDRATRGIAVRNYPADQVAELFEIREALESVLVCHAVAGLPADGELRLRNCLKTAADALAVGDSGAAVAANARFHEELVEVAAGPMLKAQLKGVRDRMRWLLRQHGDPTAIHAEHERMLAAILDGDLPGAKVLFQQHLATSRRAFAQRTEAIGGTG